MVHGCWETMKKRKSQAFTCIRGLVLLTRIVLSAAEIAPHCATSGKDVSHSRALNTLAWTSSSDTHLSITCARVCVSVWVSGRERCALDVVERDWSLREGGGVRS